MPATKELSFDVSKTESLLIENIVTRAIERMGLHARDRLDLSMDLTAVVANGCPMRLQDLLDADDMDFLHDIGGIRRYLDRRTGQLTDCFCPRFAVPQNDDLDTLAHDDAVDAAEHFGSPRPL